MTISYHSLCYAFYEYHIFIKNYIPERIRDMLAQCAEGTEKPLGMFRFLDFCLQCKLSYVYTGGNSR